MMRECDACKKTYAPGEPGHKLLCYDLDPSWGMGLRFWLCEVTAPAFEKMLANFKTKNHIGDWFGPREKRK